MYLKGTVGLVDVVDYPIVPFFIPCSVYLHDLTHPERHCLGMSFHFFIRTFPDWDGSAIGIGVVSRIRIGVFHLLSAGGVCWVERYRFSGGGDNVVAPEQGSQVCL